FRVLPETARVRHQYRGVQVRGYSKSNAEDRGAFRAPFWGRRCQGRSESLRDRVWCSATDEPDEERTRLSQHTESQQRLHKVLRRQRCLPVLPRLERTISQI